MRFADPTACPDCRGALAGQSTCPHCGLDLTSVEVRQLWQLLLQADDLLARAKRSTAPSAPRAPEARTTPPRDESPLPPTYAPLPRPAPPRPAAPASPARSWSVGTILLVLGPFALVVAGLIFVTTSWDSLGLAARTLILLAATAAVAAVGVWVTRRPLWASAEAVWTIVLSLLTLDFFAARHEGLAGLDGLEIAWSWAVWGVLALALSVGIAVWARRHVHTALIAPAIAGGLAITIAGIGAGAVADDWDFAWRAVVALVVAGLLALATRPAALPPLTVVARVVVAVFFLAAYVSALVDLVDHPSLRQVTEDAHGAPMLAMGVASVVVAALVRPARIVATALAVLAACALVATPVADAGDVEAGWAIVMGLGALLAVAGTHGTGDWMRGVRLGALPTVGGVLLIHLVLLADSVATAATVLDDPWSAAWDWRVDAASVHDRAAWVVPCVAVGLAVVAWCVPRWPELHDVREHAHGVFVWAVAVGAIGETVTLRPPVWATATILAVAAAALALVAARRLVPAAGPAAVLLVAASAIAAAASHGVSAVAWPVGSLVLVALVVAPAAVVLRQAYAAGAVALGLVGVMAVVCLLDVDETVTVVVVLLSALAAVAAAGLLLTVHPVRVPVEVTAGVGGVVALLWDGSTGEVAVRWTVAGVVLLALATSVASRRWYVWPGAASLVVAYVLLVVDSGFSFVEAYTLPLGVVALAGGLYALRRRPDLGTWPTLGPGLAISLLPSLPQALADPTDLRALLLGLGAAAVLAVGVRLGWQAPFVLGVTVLALLVLVNIGPYANAAPRVVLLATLGAVATGLGITWEERMRDGRRLVGYVRAMS